jgi:septum formation protein
MMPLLILGSASPRRREILTNLRVPFELCAASADETLLPGETAAAYLPRVVLAKLAAVRAAASRDLLARASAILVADTSVVVDARILGKPETPDEAAQMVRALSGRTHEVHTRFALAATEATGATGETTPWHAETVVTRVTFRALAETEIAAYAASGEGSDKAGGYAVQGLGAGLVARIDGSYSAVVGLPAAEVVAALGGLR